MVAFLSLAALTPAAPDDKFFFVDLGPYFNMMRDDNFGSGRDGNDLKSVGKKGSRTFGGVNFKLGDGVVQLNSQFLAKQKPTKVEGIKVGRAAKKIYIVHGTGYGNGQGTGTPGNPGEPGFVADGTKIAEYKVHYADNTSAVIPVVYGEDVRDWWAVENAPGVKRGKIAWKGQNALTKEFDCGIRLYLTSWDNPHPAKKIANIDYVKVGDSPAAPFCVAITLEAR
jgi:hypothetical protein